MHVDKKEVIVVAASAALFVGLEMFNIVSLVYIAVVSFGLKLRTVLILIHLEMLVSAFFRGYMWFSVASIIKVPLILGVLAYYLFGFAEVGFFRLILKFTPVPRIIMEAFGHVLTNT